MEQADSSSPASNLVRRVTSTAVASLAALSSMPTVVSSPLASAMSHDNGTTTAPQEKTRALHDLIAGGVAGSAGIIVGHPLDSLKVRMQLVASSASASASPVARAATASAGSGASSQFGSIWNGIGAPLAMASIINASIFLTYGGTTRLWDELFLDANHQERAVSAKHVICGGFTGAVSSFIVCPTEHIKTKLQSASNNVVGTHTSSLVYRDSFHAARNILTNHGISGLYCGVTATIVRQSIGMAIYFGTYDELKKSLKKQYNYSFNSNSNTATTSGSTLLASIAAGGIAGCISWGMIYPMDLIKSRIQALPLDCRKSERSIIRIAKEVANQGGWRALYRGFGMCIMRAFPVNAIIFPTYELTLGALKGY